MATTGRSPPIAMPAAPVTACCSAIPTSKNRSGKRSWNGKRPDGRVEHGGVVEVLLVVVFGGRIAPPLLGDDVHDDRPVELRRIAQRPLERLDVVAVDRTGVAHTERLEERRRLEVLPQ